MANENIPTEDNKTTDFTQEGRPPRSEETQKAFEILTKLLVDEEGDPHHRISAARTILDHAHL